MNTNKRAYILCHLPNNLHDRKVVIDSPNWIKYHNWHTCVTPKIWKYQKKWGPITSFYFWHIFITWVVVGGKRNPKEIIQRKFVKKRITIAKFGVIPLVDDGQPVWLYHKIEEKTHRSNRPTIPMSQIQKIAKHNFF